METKLTWAELRKAIAARLNTNEKEVNTFLNAFVPSITEALKQDRQVKINNFGMFKLQEIAPRKSVNVVTGEPIIIEGYNKLTFSAESAIKELVMHTSTSTTSSVHSAINPLTKLHEQANEIVDILADLGQPVVEQPQPQPEPQPKPKPKQNEVRQPQPEPQPKPKPKQNEVRQPQPKKRRPWLWVGLIVIILAILLSLAFLFYGQKIIHWVATHTSSEQIDEAAMAQDDIAEVEAEADADAESGLFTDDVVITSTLPYPYAYKQFIATERLTKGNRLAQLARKYYGEKDMWVFIFEANRDRIKHPSDILIGTPIRIPKLPKELRDVNNPETRQLVDRLIEEYKAL